MIKAAGKDAVGAYMAAWSGGKDSCLALFRALREGLRVTRLLHFARRSDQHGVAPELVRLQASLTGIGLIQRPVAEGEDFGAVFGETVADAAPLGVVFGDIFLQGHREWIERVCGELGVEARLPLWGGDTTGLFGEFLDEGFEAVVVSGRAGLIERRWIGGKVDREFMDYLKSRGLDPCGEEGEFHTFVTGGPLFSGNIRINRGVVTEREGRLFYGIKDYEVV